MLDSRRTRVCGLGTLLLLVLLTAHSSAAPVLESIRDRLVHMAARWASRTLNGSLDVGALRGSLLSAPVLVDVTLRDAQGDVVAQIAEVRLTYSLKNLLQRRLDIQSVEIIRPQVTIAQDAEGRLNLSQLLASTEPTTPESESGWSFTLSIARLLIRDGQVSVRLPTLPGVQQVADMQAELRAHVDQAGLRLEVQQGTAQAHPADVALRSIQGSVQAQGGVVRLEAVRLQTTETLLSVDGVLPGISQAADLSLRTEPLALTEVGRILQQEALQGALYAAVQAEGRRGALRLHGQLQADASTAHLTASGVLDLAGQSDLRYALTAALEDMAPVLALPSIAGTVHLQGQASGAWPALYLQGRLEAQRLRYQEQQLDRLRLTYDGTPLGPQPQLTASLVAQQAQLGGLPVEQVTVEALYAGPTEPVRLAAEVVQSEGTGGTARGIVIREAPGLRLELDTLEVRLPERTWHAVAPLQVAFAPGRVAFQQVRLRHAEEALALTGAVDGAHLQDLRLHLERLDLAYVQRFLPVPEALSGRLSGTLQADGSLAAPGMQADLRLYPTAPHLPFEQLKTTLAYAEHRLQGMVVLYQAQRQVLGLDVDLPVDLAWTDVPLAQRLLDAPLSVRLDLAQPDLQALRHWQPTLPPLAGTLQGSLAGQGTYARLGLEADLELQDFTFAGEVTHLTAPAHLTGTLVTAVSVADLTQALAQNLVTPQLQELVVHVPTLHGQLPRPDAPAEPFAARDLRLQAALRWTTEGLHATVDQLSLQASGFGVSEAHLRLAADWRPPRLELTQVQVRTLDSELQGQGFLTLPEAQGELRLTIPRLRLDALPLDWPPTLPPIVHGVLTARGRLQAPQVEARLQYAGGEIHADFRGQLQPAVPRYQATVRLAGIELAHFLPEAQGRLQATAQVQGQGWSGPARQARLDLTAATQGLNLAPDLSARLQASLAGSTLRLQQLHLRSAPAELLASGTLSASQQAAVRYTLRLRDLSALQPHLGLAIQGRGSLRGELQGPLRALQTRGTLRLDGWQVADWRGGPVQATFAAAPLASAPQGSVQAQLADVQGPHLQPSSLRLGGSYAAPQGTFTLAVSAGPYQQTQVAGTVLLAETINLSLRTVRLRYQGLAWDNVGAVEVARRPAGEVQVRRLVLRSQNQEIRVQGAVTPAGALSGTVQAQRLRLRPTAQLLTPATDVPEGRLNLDLSLAGSLQQPQLDGTVRLTALQWRQQMLGEVAATVGLRDSTARLDLRWLRQGQTLLQAQGTVGLDAAAALDLQVQARRVSLALLQPLVPGVTESSGWLALEARLTGTRQHPQGQGTLSLQDGVLQLAATGERYRDIQARLRLAGNRLDIAQLSIGSRSGPLEVAGSVTLAGLTPQQVALTVQAREFTAIHTSEAQAMLSAAIEVQGAGQDVQVTGTVTVLQARLRFDEIPGSRPRTVKPWQLTVQGVYGPGPKAVGMPQETTASPSFLQTFLPFLQARVQIDLPRNVWLQGPGTAVELRGEVLVSKDHHEPWVLGGTLTTVRGFAGYYGKRFTVERGEVTFTGAPEINPQLDVLLTQRVADYTVSIRVTGRARQPEITLSSTPELPQADVLSLIVLGKTTDRLTGTEQNALADQAQQFVGTLIANQLTPLVGSVLGLDTIDITAGQRLGTGSLRVGRYITQDLFVSYELEVGASPSNTARSTIGASNTIGIEYSLTERLRLQASASEEGETALDLLWRLDY